MIGTILANLLRFVVLVLLQVFLLDRMELLNGYMVPYLYVLFLLMLPFEVPAWGAMLIGFMTGVVMDAFSDTPGMHASACVLMMFVRTYVLRLLSPREGYEYGLSPTVVRMGLAWFTTYALLLVLVHHTWLFFIEVYRFDRFFGTFSRVILSTVFTMLLCMMAQFLSARSTRSRA